MSNDKVLDEAFDDWSFDDKPVETEVSGGKVHFARLRVLPPVNIVPFQAGEHFTIPGVFNDAFDEATSTSTRQGLKEFKGMQKGRTSKGHKLFILVAEKDNKQGNPYQVIKRFNSWKGRDEEVYEWGDKQWPALLAIDPQYRDRVKKTGYVAPDSPESWVYARYLQEATGNTWTNDEGKKQERHFWTDFTIYSNREAWQKASDEHFAQFSNSDSAPKSDVDYSHFPPQWANAADPTSLYTTIKGGITQGQEEAQLIQFYGLSGEDVNGQPVNADRIIAEAKAFVPFQENKMRTEYIQKTTSNTQNVTFGYWDEQETEWVSIDANNVQEVAELLKASPELLNVLLSTFEDLIGNLNSDLLTIWERLNAMDKLQLMSILIDPDELKSSSRFPFSIATISNPGLEALTGSDFVISQHPIQVVQETLQSHIDGKSLFVQRKHGYDILNFDGLKSSISRMKKCDIPQQQCILLFIGKDEPATLSDVDSDKFTISGQEPYAEVTYKTLQKVKALWRYRGGVVDQIPYPEALAHWIEAQSEALQDVMEQGKREVYPSQQPVWESDDVWQEIEEVPRDDPRWLLCAIDGIGPTIANRVRDYCIAGGWGFTYYTALKVLTDLDVTGKSVHKVKGWGKGLRDKLRRMLDLSHNEMFTYNLYVSDIKDLNDPGASHLRGVKVGIKFIEYGIKRMGLSGGQAIENAKKMAETYKSGRWLE